jgi:hypothetical protein
MTNKTRGRILTLTPVVPSPGYLAYYPAMQNTPDLVLTDRSGKVNDGGFDAALTSAAAWANAGYITTALNGAYPWLPKDIYNSWRYDLGESLLIHFRGLITPPAANNAVMGPGVDATTHTGIKLRVLTTGNMDIGFYGGGVSSFCSQMTAAASASVEGAYTYFIDGVNKKIWTWFNNTPVAVGETITPTVLTAPVYDCRIGGYGPTGNGVVAKLRNIHIIKTANMKYTGNDTKLELVNHLMAHPFIPLSNADWTV